MSLAESSAPQTEDPVLVEVQRAISRGNWTKALRLAKSSPGNPREKLERFLAVGDWIQELSIGRRMAEAREAADWADLPTNVAIALVDAQIALGMRVEATELAERILVRHPAKTTARRALLRSLEDRDQPERVLELAMGLWQEGQNSVLRVLSTALIDLGETDRCRGFLDDAATRMSPDDHSPLLRARRALALSLGNHDEALSILGDLEGRIPEASLMNMLAHQAKVTAREDLADRALQAVIRWADDPDCRADLLDHGPQVLHSLWACRPDEGRHGQLLESICSYLLPPASARAAAHGWSHMGRDDQALPVLRRTAEAFPSAWHTWSVLLTLNGRLKDEAALRDLVDEMRAKLPIATRMTAMLESMPSAWPAEDVPEIAEFAGASRDPMIGAAFASALTKVTALPQSLEEAIEARVSRDRPVNGLRMAFVLRRAHDRRRLQEAVLAPVDMAEFRDRRAETSLHLHDMFSATLAGGDADIGAGLWKPWLASAWKRIDDLSAKSLVSLTQSAESFADAADLADKIVEHILQRRPMSALRIGDCEGCFLGATDDDLIVLGRRQHCKSVWWGDRQPDSGTEEGLVAAFLGAVHNADILGVLPPWRLVANVLHRGGGVKPIQGAISFGLDRLFESFDLRVLASAHFHEDLDSWALWEEVFAAAASVSWISCHDLSSYLRQRCGVDTRLGLRIPAEQKYSGLFKMREKHDDAAASEPGARLIDVHGDILASLAPTPGEVWLVAAGFLGKIYCEVIRQRGGIALDIGSIADYWMGFATRNSHPSGGDFPAPSMLPIRGRNRPQPDPADVARRLRGLPGVAYSSRVGGRNMATPDEASPPPPAQSLPLRVIGHPRCASGYMATVFSARGVRIGHERVARDGISSWMYVVRDHNLPYGDNLTVTHRFDRTVLHLRDPAHAIPSIMLENGVGPSFWFRRGHIFRATGEDLASLEDPMMRAIASYVHWHQMALDLKPDAVIAVERAEDEVSAWLASVGLDADPGTSARGIHGYNATERKAAFVLTKPRISMADWAELARNLPTRLREGMEEICAHGRYALPWEVSE